MQPPVSKSSARNQRHVSHFSGGTCLCFSGSGPGPNHLRQPTLWVLILAVLKKLLEHVSKKHFACCLFGRVCSSLRAEILQCKDYEIGSSALHSENTLPKRNLPASETEQNYDNRYKIHHFCLAVVMIVGKQIPGIKSLEISIPFSHLEKNRC